MAGIAKQFALRLAGPNRASLTCQDLASICWAFGRLGVRKSRSEGFLTLGRLRAGSGCATSEGDFETLGTACSVC